MQKDQGKLPNGAKSKLDYLKEADLIEEDAYFPEELKKSDSYRDKYFEYYDDVKTSIKEDW